MKRIIKSLSADEGRLFSISAGRREEFARFTGRIDIVEHTSQINILGRMNKGVKKIYASFVVCEDMEFTKMVDDNYLHSGKIYEAIAYVEGKSYSFAGMRFIDNNPLSNELIFEITDLELIKKLLIS